MLCLAVSSVNAQTGKITGKVINASTGQPLGGASLKLVNKNISKAADLNGQFSFTKLEAGTYSISCSYTGFQEKIVDEIIVKDNENTDINISLENKLSGEVIVTSKRTKAAGESVASLLIAQKNSASVSDGITAESIKKTPDRSSSDVIKRVSGASIQDDKFAIIRGLNDRYNASFINGAPLPSTESDRKAFAFDIFPSAILDNLVIFKTATPDKTGEFAGGIIEITTKSSSNKRVGIISIGQGFNNTITGKTRFFSETQGKKDWLGMDDGARATPAGLPNKLGFLNLPDRFNDELRLAKSFDKYKWGILNTNTLPNFNFQFVKSLNINKKQEEFISSIFSLTYNRSYNFTTGERNSFDGPGSFLGDPNDPASGYYPVQRRKFIDSSYVDEVLWGALGNIAIKINNRNNISFKNNFSINTENRLNRRRGNNDFAGEPNFLSTETFRTYIQNQIYTSQLGGEHQVGSKKTKINWLAAIGSVERKIPNQMISTDGTLPFGGQSSFGANGGIINIKSQETIKNAKLDISQPYTLFKSTQNLLKIGVGYQQRERDFVSREFGLIRYDGSTYQPDLSVYRLPEYQRFSGQYLGLMANGKAGLAVQDASVPNSDYQASSTNGNVYLMNDQRFLKKIRIIYGVRYENFNQKLTAAQRGLDTIRLDYTKPDLLPSANLVYALNPKTNFRLSYSETVNRPEFRELAPFTFYEYVSGLTVSGNPFLQRAKINNYDFRYEIYPGKAQIFSVSLFYKNFTNPIEFVTLPSSTNDASYINSASAKVYGIETEFRFLLSTLLGTTSDNSIFNKFTISGNGAYIKSAVPQKLSGLFADTIPVTRPLQGQSNYIANVALGYNDDKTGLSSTISYNRAGDRLAIAGNFDRPDYYEKQRTVIDFQIAKSFLNNKVELKFNARDLLAQPIIVYIDFDKNRKLSEQDRKFSTNIAPRVFSFSASFKF